MSAARPDTWMPIYWGDYARDTGHLSATMHGAYLMLIKHYWSTGTPLVDDDTQLWRIACCDSIGAWRKIRPIIGKFFDIEDGVWRQGRVDKELNRAVEITDERSKAGARGAAKRWQKNSKAIAEPSNSQWQTDGPSQPQSQIPYSVPNGTGGKPPPADPVKSLFDAGITVLTGAGTPDKQARSLLGRWRKDLGDDGKLMTIVLDAAKYHAVSPVEWIAAAVQAELRPKPKGGLYGGAMA